jgi:hypothetical protein
MEWSLQERTPMSTEPATYIRHPLGLPPGSVRSILALITSGLFALLILLPAARPVEIPLFLYFLMSLLMVFVVSHGKTIGIEGERHPLSMPKGTIRFLIVGVVIAAIGWQFWNNRDLLLKRLTPTAQQIEQWPWLFLALFSGFGLGRLLRAGPWRNRPMFQDILAWVSLICMIGLVVEILAVVFIKPTMPAGLDLNALENTLTMAIALYFGARS